MNRRRCLLFLVALLLSARAVQAGSVGSVDDKERRARTACLAGDYAEGIRLLSELFVTTLNATFIYNQGRCLEQSRRYDDAIGRFQEYLRAGKKLTLAEKADAQKHIDECKELLASERAQAAPPVAPTAFPLAAAAPVAPAAVVTMPAAPTPQPNPPSPGRAGWGLRTAGIVTASVGGAALVTGIILNYESNSLATDLKKTDGYTAGKESDRKTYQTFSWVGYGAGAACVAAGAILYIVGLRSASDPSLSLVPTFTPDYAGAFVKGAF
jgi:hypothetical protein